ncbi:MAG: hypothetical protein ACK4GU_13495 [Alishewanella aestuarii]
MARENVGVITCPFTKRLAVVRADCRNKKYFYSAAGKIAPNLPAGQRWINDNMQPLEKFSINETAPGYPPEVEPLTAQAAPERTEIPLTEKTGKSKSFLEAFLGD